MRPPVALEAASGAQLLPQRAGPPPRRLNEWLAHSACDADLRAKSAPHRDVAAAITITNQLTEFERAILARIDLTENDLTTTPTTAALAAEEGTNR